MNNTLENPQDQTPQPNNGIEKTPDQLRAAQDAQEQKAKPSAWLGDTASPPSATISEPNTRLPEKLQAEQDTQERLRGESPWLAGPTDKK